MKRINRAYPSVLELISTQDRLGIQVYGTIGNPYLRSGAVIDNIFVDTTALCVDRAYLEPEQFWPLSDHRYIYATFNWRE